MKSRWFTIFILFFLFFIFSCRESVSTLEESAAREENNIPDLSNNTPPSHPADTIKILFIGNSLTFYYNMPGMVQQMAAAGGKTVLAVSATMAGVALRHMVNNAYITGKINSDDWDYIVLQSDDITAFPDMYDIEINTLNSFKHTIYNNNPATRIIYLMVWGLRNGVTIQELNGEYVYYSYLEYIQKIYNGTLFIAGETEVIISPAGWAWRQVRMEHPEIELFSSDNAHPSYKGSFLCAAVHYAVIFRESCGNIPYAGDLPEEEAAILRSTASEIVLNNLDLWNLGEPNGISL